jgi:Lipocalin-like domain
MNWRNIFGIFSISVLGLALTTSGVIAQQKSLKDQLVGTWQFVSSTGKLADGSPTWGSNPTGLLIFTENGRFSVQIMRTDRPKYASNNRMKGTPEEIKATAEGTISYFGTYAVSEADKTVTYKIEGASFPNWNGTDQKRPVVSLMADELKYNNPAPSIGGPATELVWKRIK